MKGLDQKSVFSPTISYLHQEITHLNEKILDLEETIKLSKNSLKVSLSISQKGVPEDKALRQIISNLEEELLQYQQTISRLQTQSEHYQGRVSLFNKNLKILRFCFFL